jgi:hypothetical protein
MVLQLCATPAALLDQQAPETIAAVGAPSSGCSAEVVDIHLWSIGPATAPPSSRCLPAAT